ncbi:bifunctional diguanylate cyclase/phosphodiesterase [Acidocella sp.]|uniref:putative bifunctional diguanylate cyclase/phosphodiesterase n=1 Tax=Acidocella sp. TaxID=50710 RepID=UPI00262DC6AF|nr:EAL domain-containing protein [Acidocella sp.]
MVRMRQLAGLIEDAHVMPGIAERLLLDQATDFSYLITAISLLGLSTAGLLYWDFWHNPGDPWRVAGMGAVLFCYAAILASATLWIRQRHPTARRAKRYITFMSQLLLLLGASWSLLLTLLASTAHPAQLSMLYGVMVGCLATPVMVSPALCALAYWLPVSIGICVAVVVSGVADNFAIIDLLSFMLLTGFCILYLNRRLNERAIGAIRLEENAEVIKLLLRDFEESASDWLWEANAALELQPVSPRLSQVARRAAENFTGKLPAALLGPVIERNGTPDPAIARLMRAMDERSPFRDLVVPVMVEGEQRFWSLTGKPILDKRGHFAGYHGVGSDITGQRRQQEQIAFLARHDSLTKLPNRVLFSELLHEACTHAGQRGIALLCLDLDNFKLINDTLGHATGDAVLVAVAERLKGAMRQGDIAARLGGGEFAVILYTSDIEEALSIAARIIERISRPYRFDGQLAHIGMSIGLTMAPKDGKAPGTLMKNADLALYRAKAEGRGVARLYDPAMDQRLQGRRQMQAGLRHALGAGEFYLEYQPIIDLSSRRITGAEALIRWRSPERGLVNPAEFIPIAEETGLINDIGDWVLCEACKTAATWPAPLSVAVNLSPLQFRDPALIDTIKAALRDSGLPPERLEIEIVESVMLESTTHTEYALWQLHGLGVRIALDDFGTGYSSLSYLRRFPFDKIKIDRSFIRDLGYEKDDSSIILAIIGLAERMNMVVTAEGVENEEQLVLLSAYGCTQGQGYFFHRPLPAPRFLEVLRANEAPFAAPPAANAGTVL